MNNPINRNRHPIFKMRRNTRKPSIKLADHVADRTGIHFELRLPAGKPLAQHTRYDDMSHPALF
jgi:hypothetical protein